MKHISLACFTVCSLFAIRSFAQLTLQPAQPQPSRPPDPLKKHSVGFDVKNVGSGSAAKVSSLGAGSKTQTDASAPSYEVTIRNFSPQPDTVTLEWFIFSKSVDGRGPIRVHDRGSQSVALEGGKTVTVTFQPNPIVRQTRDSTTYTTQTYTDGSHTTTAESSRTRTGMKLAGWVVRLQADGQMIGYKVSDPSFEDYGKYPEKIQNLGTGAGQRAGFPPQLGGPQTR